MRSSFLTAAIALRSLPSVIFISSPDKSCTVIAQSSERRNAPRNQQGSEGDRAGREDSSGTLQGGGRVVQQKWVFTFPCDALGAAGAAWAVKPLRTDSVSRGSSISFFTRATISVSISTRVLFSCCNLIGKNEADPTCKDCLLLPCT